MKFLPLFSSFLSFFVFQFALDDAYNEFPCFLSPQSISRILQLRICNSFLLYVFLYELSMCWFFRMFYYRNCMRIFLFSDAESQYDLLNVHLFCMSYCNEGTGKVFALSGIFDAFLNFLFHWRLFHILCKWKVSFLSIYIIR